MSSQDIRGRLTIWSKRMFPLGLLLWRYIWAALIGKWACKPLDFIPLQRPQSTPGSEYHIYVRRPAQWGQKLPKLFHNFPQLSHSNSPSNWRPQSWFPGLPSGAQVLQPDAVDLAQSNTSGAASTSQAAPLAWGQKRGPSAQCSCSPKKKKKRKSEIVKFPFKLKTPVHPCRTCFT